MSIINNAKQVVSVPACKLHSWRREQPLSQELMQSGVVSIVAIYLTHTLDQRNCEMRLTLALTSLLAVLILASQKAPRYLALTSVPTVK